MNKIIKRNLCTSGILGCLLFILGLSSFYTKAAVILGLVCLSVLVLSATYGFIYLIVEEIIK